MWRLIFKAAAYIWWFGSLLTSPNSTIEYTSPVLLPNWGFCVVASFGGIIIPSISSIWNATPSRTVSTRMRQNNLIHQRANFNTFSRQSVPRNFLARWIRETACRMSGVGWAGRWIEEGKIGVFNRVSLQLLLSLTPTTVTPSDVWWHFNHWLFGTVFHFHLSLSLSSENPLPFPTFPVHISSLPTFCNLSHSFPFAQSPSSFPSSVPSLHHSLTLRFPSPCHVHPLFGNEKLLSPRGITKINLLSSSFLRWVTVWCWRGEWGRVRERRSGVEWKVGMGANKVRGC